MARFNEILAGRYNRFLQKFLSMKGPPPAPQLASELSATWSMFHGRENRYLEDWKTYGGFTQVAAVAAQDSVSRMNNPKNSNIVAVLESLIIVTGAAASEIVAEFANSDPGSLVPTFTPASFDNRTNPPGNGSNGAAAVLSNQNNIGAAGFFVFAHVLMGAGINQLPELITYEDQQITLLPGSALQVRTITLNTSLIVSYRWRERALEDSEKT